MKLIQGIEFNIEAWKEGKTFVSHVPQLDIASCGSSVDKARKNIREALELYLEEAESMGTLKQILEEAGFEVDKKKHWHAPKILTHERFSLAI